MSDDPTFNLSRRQVLQFTSAAGATLAATDILAAAATRPGDADSPLSKVNSLHPDASLNTADLLVETLIAWDVPFVFGLVGDGINSITEALRKRQDRIKFITVRHEEAAAFMACGYAKHAGKLGVCLATTGPGAVHLLNGLYDAKMDSTPVLAITGTTFHDLIGTSFQQGVDTLALMRDVALYNVQVTGPLHVRIVGNLACRAALSAWCRAFEYCERHASDAVERRQTLHGKPWTPNLFTLGVPAGRTVPGSPSRSGSRSERRPQGSDSRRPGCARRTT
jgi:pyruvate dehydrogenase (quinone)